MNALRRTRARAVTFAKTLSCTVAVAAFVASHRSHAQSPEESSVISTNLSDLELVQFAKAEPKFAAAAFDLVQSRSIVAVSPLVVDLAAGKLLGGVPGRPLAVADDGRVLVAAGGDASADRLAMGPLVWRLPEQAGQ